jgi:hypothetical protein
VAGCFDKQDSKIIRNMIGNLDPKLSYVKQYIKEEDEITQEIRKSVEAAINQKYVEKENKNVKANVDANKDVPEVPKNAKRTPLNNQMISGAKQASITFVYEIKLNIDIENLKNVTVLSSAFNSSTRSWILKIDVLSNGEVSVYLIERGDPISDKDSQKSRLHSISSMHKIMFTSALFVISVDDPQLKKEFLIFFSFSHDQHQIIGCKEFFNAKDLGNKQSITLKVRITEMFLHSSIMHYICFDYASLCKHMKMPHKEGQPIDLKETNEAGMNEMSPYDLYYIYSSNFLRIESENIIFSGYYRYTYHKDQSVCEMLIDAVRLQYVSGRSLFSGLRDHPAMKMSPIIRKKIHNELARRNCSIPGQSEAPRKFYSQELIKAKQLSDEVYEWIFMSDHTREQYYNDACKKLLEDEQKKRIKMENDLQRVNRELTELRREHDRERMAMQCNEQKDAGKKGNCVVF